MLNDDDDDDGGKNLKLMNKASGLKRPGPVSY